MRTKISFCLDLISSYIESKKYICYATKIKTDFQENTSFKLRLLFLIKLFEEGECWKEFKFIHLFSQRLYNYSKKISNYYPRNNHYEINSLLKSVKNA